MADAGKKAVTTFTPTATSAATSIAIGFSYIDQASIQVSRNGTVKPVGGEWSFGGSGDTVEYSATLETTDSVEIRRVTTMTVPEKQDGQPLPAKTVNDSFRRITYRNEEIEDLVS